MRTFVITLSFLMAMTTIAFAGDVTYWFCVTGEYQGRYRVKVTFEAVDLGREAAKLMALNEVRPLMGNGSISIAKYNPETCKCLGGECEILEVTGHNIDGKIAQNLLEGGPETLPGSVATMVAAATKEGKDIIHAPDQAVKKPVKEVKKFLRKNGIKL